MGGRFGTCIRAALPELLARLSVLLRYEQASVEFLNALYLVYHDL